ncbi:substrate-binding periplasmic protein [Leucothrix arctica]|uniref:Amino acid ABC transporter substrate-binding protein n=1 Tax=Leucothrix arctica TaxID=1481894 RepID=A0A317C7B9_9GAMM|nr:transporter substrate-binding domain-containing protein [Leucothrix arctica]PWQ94209.1 amino acid ABC transporter substrate-binding protein [Leucothrix arctica]
MQNKLLKLLALMILLVPNLAFSQTMEVVYPKTQSEGDARFNDLLTLLEASLEATRDTHGDYILRPSNEPMSEGRYLQEVQAGDSVNLVYSGTSVEQEQLLIPIRIPLRKGLLGYRLFLIHKDKQPVFSKVTSLEQLKQLTLGQGHDWGDLKVYRPNKFSIETASKYESLFKMVVKGRFDYFPRGINEAPVEYSQRVESLPDLAVEKELMLFYTWPYYFFVSKKHPEIAERVEAGLRKMIQSGEFDKIFYEYHGDTIKRGNIESRRLFKVINPVLPPETPIDDVELWFDPVRDLDKLSNY